MQLIKTVLAVVGIACCATFLAFSPNRPSPTTLNTDLTDIDFIRHLAKYGKSYGTMKEFSSRADLFRDNL
jgi:hypothetical protein